MTDNDDGNADTSSNVVFDSAQSLSIIASHLNQSSPLNPTNGATEGTVQSDNNDSTLQRQNESNDQPSSSRDVEEILVRVINEDLTRLTLPSYSNSNVAARHVESGAAEERLVIDDSVTAGTTESSVNNPSRNTRNFPFNSSVQRSFAMKAHRCYRAVCGQTNSDMDVSMIPNLASSGLQEPPPLSGAPPSYSAIMQQHSDHWIITERRPICLQPSPTFIPPIPPPTYAEVQGFQVERPMMIASIDHIVWGPEPLTVICPRCSHVVVTSTESRRSNLTHFSALILCVFGCWPCCVLPYCMDSCQNTYHRCPTCDQFLGMYRPW